MKRAAPGDYSLPKQPIPGANSVTGPRRAAEVRAHLVSQTILGTFCSFLNCTSVTLQKVPIDAGFRITTLVFFTPGERAMKVAEAQRSGYGITNTPTRLVLRSSKASPETYSQTVSGPLDPLAKLLAAHLV